MAKKKQTEVSAEEKIVDEAHKRFARCVEHESEARTLWENDLRFANADPDNGWQWEREMRKQRILDKRPSLTINKVKQHNRQITNDARQNKPSVRVLPVDSGADTKTADILNGIIRHIEANSSADTAYDTAAEFAVDAGLGYWRIVTDYASDDSFDQEIFIKRVKNPLNVYLDQDIQEADGSDAKFGFVFEDISKDEFERKYPDAETGGSQSWGSVPGGWMTKDTIRVAEYFRITYKTDTLIAGPDGQTMKLSEIQDPDVAKAIQADTTIKTRKISVPVVEWYKIAGDKILEKNDWLGRYIPIVRVVGDEIEIDGKVDRKGHTRAMKDAQRMYNYWTTSAVEFVALQGKQPYLSPAEAIEGYEKYWDNLNTSNLPYLPYNSTDEAGNQIPMPQRQQPPVMAAAYMSGMQVASDEMKAASGQYNPSFGINEQSQSGRAVMALQRKGDNATFHFVDNVARAIKYTGKILVDLIPKIYDTPRVVRILGEDGTEDKAHIDPTQKQSVTSQKDDLTGEIREIYNPSVGRYDVVVAVGPSYGTKRQEAFQALTEMSSRNPQLLQVAGDLIMKAADFPMADQIAERLEKTLPPGLRDDDENQPTDPKVQQLTQQVQQMDQVIQKMTEEVEGNDIERRKLEIDEYNAETNRLKVIGAGMSPEQVQQIVMQTLQETFMQHQEDIQEDQQDMQGPMQQAEPMQEPPPHEAMEPQPPQGGFFSPQGN
ncbi:MAG: portal protein [Burkholderiales bacterium]